MEVTNEVLIYSTVAIFLLLSGICTVLFAMMKHNRLYEKNLHFTSDKMLESSRLMETVKLEIQDETMNYVSKELHDNLGHSLTLINMELQNITDKVSNDLKEEILEVSMMVTKLTGDVRDIFSGLRSIQGKTSLLSEDLKLELDRMKKTARIKTSLEIVGEEMKLRTDDQVLLFRMFQEILHNVLKHANASAVNVTLIFSEKMVVLTVTDNGKGFNSEIIDSMGMGLANLEERALMIGATLDIDSKTGTGTTVQITKPLKLARYATN